MNLWLRTALVSSDVIGTTAGGGAVNGVASEGLTSEILSVRRGARIAELWVEWGSEVLGQWS